MNKLQRRIKSFIDTVQALTVVALFWACCYWLTYNLGAELIKQGLLQGY